MVTKSESNVNDLTSWLSFLEARASNYISMASTTLGVLIAFILSIAASFTDIIEQEWITYSLIGVFALLSIIYSLLVWKAGGFPLMKALRAKEIADKIIKGELKTSKEVQEECKEKLL